ncbi:MAG TPA: response regulator transcription factor, partial [Candidatus Polarisedimenticolia bacterium]|nr:response regulator transcription factor [Candidatus Polarisedimenticolia bacterium]
VGQAADGREAVLMTRELEPDVVIMDISMPELNGIEATRIITGENPHAKIIALSMHQQEEMASAMLAAGAKRYFTKGGPTEDLVQAVRELGAAAAADGSRAGRAPA